MEKEHKEKQQQIWDDIKEKNRRLQEMADAGEDKGWEEEEEEQEDYDNDSTRKEEKEENRAKENNKDDQRQKQEWDKRGNDEDELRKKQMQLINMQIKAAADTAEASAKKA